MRLTTALPLMLLTATAGAQIERDLGAHVHGSATLNLAVEGEILDMEFEIPGMDVVGFERGARSEAEREAIDTAIQLLEVADWVALPVQADCRLISADVHTHGFADTAKDHEAHADDHAHHAHESDPQTEHDGHDHHDGHAEFHGKLSWRCGAPQALRTIDFRLGERFPAIQRLTVQALGERGQQRVELPAGNGRLSL